MKANIIDLFENAWSSIDERKILFSAIYSKYYNAFAATAKSFRFSSHDADNVIHDFFTDNLMNPSRFESYLKAARSGYFDRYIFKSFKNHCLGQLKKIKRQPLVTELPVDLKCSLFETYNNNTEKRHLLNGVLNNLPDHQKIVLTYWLSGYNPRDIVELLNNERTLDGIKSSIYKAKKKLRIFFEKNPLYIELLAS